MGWNELPDRPASVHDQIVSGHVGGCIAREEDQRTPIVRATGHAADGTVADLTHEVRQTIGPDVAQEILRVAAETDAAVVVIGLRHRTPVGKMIMGSVAQQVLLDAHCAVLAVKPSISTT